MKPENFFQNMENVANGIFRVNLHLHTTASDGKFTIPDLFDQLSEYAKTVKNPPFIVSITDHDNVEGAKEAIRYMAANPEKFKHVLFAPGNRI